MEIIDELEPTRRGLYTGAIGYLGRGGTSGFNIAIRTMLVEGDRVSYQVGGGIVADSDPQARIRGDPAQGRGLRAVLEGKDVACMIWVRGQIVPDDALAISVLDRTFEHGLGLFETFRTWNGQPTLLPRHLERLTRSAAELGLPLDREACPIEQAVRALLARRARRRRRAPDHAQRRDLGTSGSTLWMRSFPLPPAAADGVILGPAGPARVDLLAGHKTLNYWPNRSMYENARSGGFDECVSVSPDGISGKGAGPTSSW